jgi:hypothetical protein
MFQHERIETGPVCRGVRWHLRTLRPDGDVQVRSLYAEVARAWRASGLPAMMSVLQNDGRWQASNAIYADGRVLEYDKRSPCAGMRWIDYGLGGARALGPRARPGDHDRSGRASRSAS